MGLPTPPLHPTSPSTFGGRACIPVSWRLHIGLKLAQNVAGGGVLAHVQGGPPAGCLPAPDRRAPYPYLLRKVARSGGESRAGVIV